VQPGCEKKSNLVERIDEIRVTKQYIEYFGGYPYLQTLDHSYSSQGSKQLVEILRFLVAPTPLGCSKNVDS